MNDDEINYQNNPLHGVSLKNMLVEIVEHYGFDILFAYLNINCFNTNPSIASSLKFLKKTDWAREKAENFYLYQFKSLPRASAEDFLLPPRDRIIPADVSPGEPAKLSLEDAERLREKREKKTAGKRPGQSNRYAKPRSPSASPYGKRASPYTEKPSRAADSSEPSDAAAVDPWGKWSKKPE